MLRPSRWPTWQATRGAARSHRLPTASRGRARSCVTPSIGRRPCQNPGGPTPVGSFDITQLGQPARQGRQGHNFRGITIHDNVVYYTKGSGGNGINTVYFIDTTGKACPGAASASRSPAQRCRARRHRVSTRRRSDGEQGQQRSAAEQHVHPARVPDDARPARPRRLDSRSASGSRTTGHAVRRR